MKKISTLSLLFFLFLGGVMAQKSALADGEIFKIAVEATGIYKLDYNYLKNTVGIALDQVDPRKIQILGNGGGMLPGLIDGNYNNHEKDLIENAIFISGEADGRFDASDYLLFYGQGPSIVQFDPVNNRLTIPTNVFDTRNYYFIKIGTQNGKRLDNRASLGSGSYKSAAFDEVQRYEDDRINLLNFWVNAQGSGQRFFGDQFKNQRLRSYSDKFNFPNLITQEPVFLRAEMAARTNTSSSFFRVLAENEVLRSSNFSAVAIPGDGESDFCRSRTVSGTFSASGDQPNISVEYPATLNESEGWLDYIEVSARRQLRMTGNQMEFRDLRAISQPSIEFQMSNATPDLLIWDVTDPLQPISQARDVNGGTLTFSVPGLPSPQVFIAFDPAASLLLPAASLGQVENQNIHGASSANLAIVYHPDFEEAVQKLADHRRRHNGYEVITVRIEQILNEFSSGKTDPVAIRDFAKMMFDRNPEAFKFLLLFGDGSFDPRNIYKFGRNFVPVYETEESFNPVESFPSDDYFALLSENEGADLRGGLDIAVGRIPVETAQEAEDVVNKIIRYDSDPVMFRDWRNRLAFVGDDEDNFVHVAASEDISRQIDRDYPNFNVEKIYLDAFQQESTSGGQKYPAVNDAIDKAFFKGLNIINYFGHGGSKGLAQERVIKVENIINWENEDRLPLFITATCSFTGYDAPDFKTAGELVLLNPRGGAFALFSTTRAVYISGNEILVKSVFDRIFEEVDGAYPTLGEIFTRAKNAVSTTSTNVRKFTMIGDPSMHLVHVPNQVVTTAINGHDVADGLPDTLRALQKVTIEGYIADSQGNILPGFNGLVYPTIFDKKSTVYTLGQDPRSPVRPFEVQSSILFKGKASVTNGRFSFTFVMPKDINYDYGKGKISYYAENGQMVDAAGNYQNVIIGKTDPKALADNEGPKVEVFMNTADFVFGSITDNKPEIYVRLSDDNGINVAGTSIGHDLTAVLNDNTQNTFVLNDFYEAVLDDFTRGEARYPLSNLPEGRHRVFVRAWDVANNPGEGYTEFVVAGSGKAALQHVLNFPNPFTERTCFMFEHNLAGQNLDVQIQIFTVSGRLVKTLQTNLTPAGYILGPGECIEWDGLDDFGGPLARGVYLYRVKVKANGSNFGSLTGESGFEKLVILK